MPRYQVNATASMAAWCEVEADSPEDALDVARELDRHAWETDEGSMEIDFNVMPDVEAVS